MKSTIRSLFTFPVAALALAALPASAQQAASAAAPAAAPAPTVVESAGTDKFTIRLGSFLLSSINTRLSLTDESGNGGSEVDFERDLGGRDSLNVFRADGEWRFADRHKVQLSYFDIDRHASKAIDRTINWGDQTYTVNTTISTEFQTMVTKFNYGYTFYRNDAGTQEVTALLGLHVTKMKGSLGATGSGLAEGASVTAPLPVFGLEWKAKLSYGLTSHVAYEYFGISLDDDKYSGSLSDFQAMLEYQLSRHWSIGGGYNRYTSRASVISDRALNGDHLKLSVRHNYNGLMLFLSTNF